MEAKDGSSGFNFVGTYHDIKVFDKIEYSLEDDRHVHIHFINQGNQTEVRETFDTEDTYPIEFQKQGWQAILNQFKRYTESIEEGKACKK